MATPGPRKSSVERWKGYLKFKKTCAVIEEKQVPDFGNPLEKCKLKPLRFGAKSTKTDLEHFIEEI